MTKQEFLDTLKSGLSGLPKGAVDDRVNFYSEMIDDRMEDSLGEEEAVAEIGNVDDIIAHIISETPLLQIVKEKVNKKRKLRTWEIVLIILGFPVWFPVLLSVLVVILALYLCLWVVFLCFALSALCAILSSVLMIYEGVVYQALLILSGGLVCAGLSILMFYVCILSTKGIVLLLKKTVLNIKGSNVNGEE